MSKVDVLELKTNQEEADTKMFLCAAHVQGSETVCIHTVDSDIAIYAMYFQERLRSSLYIKIGTGSHSRTIDVMEVTRVLGRKICRALPALKIFSGDDYISAFHGLGKVKFFKLMIGSKEYQKIFGKLGNSFIFDTSLFASLQKFVCQLYGLKKCVTVDEARYLKFIAKEKPPEPQRLPPTADALLCHVKRVSYVTAVVKRSLESMPAIPSPVDNTYEGAGTTYGWQINGDGDLELEWMLRSPAPNDLLRVISCKCKGNCNSRACSCNAKGISCSSMCECEGCENIFDDNDNEHDENSDDEYEEESFVEL